MCVQELIDRHLGQIKRKKATALQKDQIGVFVWLRVLLRVLFYGFHLNYPTDLYENLTDPSLPLYSVSRPMLSTFTLFLNACLILILSSRESNLLRPHSNSSATNCNQPTTNSMPPSHDFNLSSLLEHELFYRFKTVSTPLYLEH